MTTQNNIPEYDPERAWKVYVIMAAIMVGAVIALALMS